MNRISVVAGPQICPCPEEIIAKVKGASFGESRKHKTGFTVAPEEGLDPLTALKCFTVGSANAVFDEAVGTLAPGKKADFAVLSHPPEKILDADMKVITTSASLL